MYENITELLKQSKADLEVVEVLARGMKENSSFSRTLDGQADVIISRAAAVNRNFKEISGTLEKLIAEVNAKSKALEGPDASILFGGKGKPAGEEPEVLGKMVTEAEVKAFQEEAAKKAAELDPATAALLEKFKDK